MNILPKEAKEFAKKEYWDKFFTHRDKSFEWYGEYADVKNILSRYMKFEDDLLVVGCGNSSLSADLYDDGYCKNTSIDISDVAIKKMVSKFQCNGLRQKMIFDCMDIFNMSYDDQRFNIVLDKGTLDALSSDNLDLNKMFSEIDRVLKPFGKYICVTLLQENIVRDLLSWFTKFGFWIVRIHFCNVAKNNDTDSVNFPVFIVICTKLKANISNGQTSIIEIEKVGTKNFHKCADRDEACNMIKSAQEIEFLKYYIRNNKINDKNFYIELFNDDNIKSRFTLYFVNKATMSNTRGAVFIVPQGREHEWLFSTEKGRDNLLKQCQVEQLIVVHLSRMHQFENMEQIKQELSPQVADFFLSDCKKINFLTIGEDIGERRILHQNTSKFCGDYIIEEVTIDNDQFRRLVFTSNQNIIQSEAKLKKVKHKKKKILVDAIDNEYLSCDHHKTISACLALMDSVKKDTFSLLLIGLGGGCLVNFITHNIKSKVNLRITVVEIDEAMQVVAKKWFDFNKNTNSAINITVEVVIADGLRFIEEGPKNNILYDYIIFDVDSKNSNLGISCPPKEFVEDSFLAKTQSCLTPEGLFILNLVARNDDVKQDIYQRIRERFAKSLLFPIENDLNEIVLCFNSCHNPWLSLKDSSQRNNYLEKSPFFINILSESYREMSNQKLSLL